jgi:uncharacterized protein involved in high-affinity Fe2+ transport
MSLRPRVKYALAAASLTALLAGCGSADNHAAASKPAAAKHIASSMAGMNMSSGSAMAGMGVADNSGVATEVPSVNGIKPVASQVLATSYWQGMKIQARTMTPTAFVVFNGTGHEQMMKPPKNSSFHLMIMLNDQHTGYAIPYAGVWATILNSAGKVVYDEQQWPMLSAYMGSHYGNNVPHLAAGHYKLKLLISPPVSARHLEYQHVWQTKHSVTESFTWKPTK